ncbi:MAG: phosphatidylserine decarboxylase [Betaproteobacteria bacterium]|nr:phosphatidylserine decarboxylase [Betaproteobacteria bacterium]MBK7794300.1 phosphatidylserine decarboxylase [Betaproteobacteria bacterium]MBK9704193.1 phosphatidylserine decarboxylase [Betaproteobacteria bacterium]
MNNYPHPLIAREGWPFLLVTGALALGLTALDYRVAAVVAWLVFAFVLQFFRDPGRVIPQGARAVLSPADGRVVKVERARDPYLDRDALKISVFMNVFNVHSNRSPVDGVVINVWYNAGSFLNAALDKASLENERNAMHLATVRGQDVTCVQIAGLIARRILCYAKVGDTLARGQRYGFIRFGSRVDVYLTPDAVAKVAIGDRVRATATVIAELPA